jgi:hypothetical protein
VALLDELRSEVGRLVGCDRTRNAEDDVHGGRDLRIKKQESREEDKVDSSLAYHIEGQRRMAARVDFMDSLANCWS